MFQLLRPLLFRLDPETAHNMTIRALSALPWPAPAADDPRLATTLAGLSLANPIGLAAGFDKNAQAPAAMASFGFGMVEVGTTTPRPQAGNPRPRLFRLVEDQAVINRLGFNNEGHAAMLTRLTRLKKLGAALGVNVGANKDSADRLADYALGVERFAGLVDYLTINISSPNTPGLRALQSRESLTELLDRCLEARGTRTTPMLLKVAPDLTEQDVEDISQVCLDRPAWGGLIVSNTTIDRPPSLRSAHASETGGLSGRPLMAPSTAVLRRFRRRVGARLPLIGVGGVASGEDAYAKLRAGASAVQLYSALVYQGPGLIGGIKQGLLTLLKRDGLSSIADAVGVDA
jgi:dihydroorotate dehydrogenase